MPDERRKIAQREIPRTVLIFDSRFSIINCGESKNYRYLTAAFAQFPNYPKHVATELRPVTLFRSNLWMVMLAYRVWLIAFMVILLGVLLTSCIEVSEVITRSNNPSYRDCSGLALPFRIVICLYTLGFFLWSGALAIAARSIGQTPMIVQIVLIAVFGILPTAAWTLLIMRVAMG